MFRITALGLLGIALLPGFASAQFMTSYIPPNPLYQHPAYQYQFYLGTTVPTTYGRAYVGVTVPFTAAPQLFSPNYGRSMPMYPWAGSGVPASGYLTGGSGRYDSYSAQRDFEKAQRDATRAWSTPEGAKNVISEQWNYEKLGIAPGAGGAAKAQADPLLQALRAASEAEVASGEALNHILTAIVGAEAKGARGVSAFVAPQQLDDIRFGGPAGDAVNLLRQSGRLPFPAVFETPELREFRDVLERDFAGVAASLLAGKPLDTTRLAKLETTLKRIETVAPPVIREQSFEDAIAARRFLNQLSNTVRALKGGGITGIINPAWATEGTKFADLVKHMTKFKLVFAAAPEGNEPAYLAIHRGLVTYLFVLTQPKK
jgi:hypothetical protein